MSKQTGLVVIIIVLVAFFGAIGFFASKQATAPTKDGYEEEVEKIKVVATFLPIYIFTKNVAGEVAVVDNLLPSDVGPHDYSFTPSDIVKVARADVVVKNNVVIDDWLDKIIQNAGNKEVKIIDTSEGIELLEGHEEDEPFNPHIWLDPILAIHQVENIRDGLVEADSANGDIYKKNAQEYIKRLRELDKEISNQLSDLTNRDFISFHAAFDYFAGRYNLNQVAVIEEFPGKEPSAKDLVKLIDLIGEKKIKALFSEPQFSPRIVETVAQDLNLPVYALDPIVTGELQNDLYEVKMLQNVNMFKKALQ